MIEETLRFEPTGPHASAADVAQDVEYYGTTVPAGSADPAAASASANRDDASLRGSRPSSTSTATRRPAPHVRLRAPLLPRRQPGPARRPGRARRAAEPLPRMGRRLRRHQAVADLDRARAGSACQSSSNEATRVRNRSSSYPTTRTSGHASSRTSAPTARRSTSTSSTASLRRRARRRLRGHNAGGQRVPRPSQLPHRGLSRLGARLADFLRRCPSVWRRDTALASTSARDAGPGHASGIGRTGGGRRLGNALVQGLALGPHSPRLRWHVRRSRLTTKSTTLDLVRGHNPERLCSRSHRSALSLERDWPNRLGSGACWSHAAEPCRYLATRGSTSRGRATGRVICGAPE